MELADLNPNEQVALAGLLEFVVLASGHVNEDEQKEIDAIVAAIGTDDYRKAVERVDQSFPDEEALRAFLSTIDRQEARELIYGSVIGAAMIDTVEGRPSELLDWLAGAWHVEVAYDEPLAGDEQTQG
ncbi:MAG: hypothetical protein ABSB49_12230 [Polyangia bacterium]|jgi:hypothetical protein